jgi:hypothetical protein
MVPPTTSAKRASSGIPSTMKRDRVSVASSASQRDALKSDPSVRRRRSGASRCGSVAMTSPTSPAASPAAKNPDKALTRNSSLS